MAKYILEGKVYDTEEAEEVLAYATVFEGAMFFGRPTYYRSPSTLYKTINGNWFSVLTDRDGKLHPKLEEVESVMKTFSELHEVDLYNTHFGDLEHG